MLCNAAPECWCCHGLLRLLHTECTGRYWFKSWKICSLHTSVVASDRSMHGMLLRLLLHAECAGLNPVKGWNDCSLYTFAGASDRYMPGLTCRSTQTTSGDTLRCLWLRGQRIQALTTVLQAVVSCVGLCI